MKLSALFPFTKGYLGSLSYGSVIGNLVGSISSEFRASRGVRLSRSRLSFSVFMSAPYVQYGESRLTSFLASLAVGIFLAAHDNGIHGYQKSQRSCQNRLHHDEHNTGDRLSCLRYSKLFNENENAYNR